MISLLESINESKQLLEGLEEFAKYADEILWMDKKDIRMISGFKNGMLQLKKGSKPAQFYIGTNDNAKGRINGDILKKFFPGYKGMEASGDLSLTAYDGYPVVEAGPTLMATKGYISILGCNCAGLECVAKKYIFVGDIKGDPSLKVNRCNMNVADEKGYIQISTWSDWDLSGSSLNASSIWFMIDPSSGVAKQLFSISDFKVSATDKSYSKLSSIDPESLLGLDKCKHTASTIIVDFSGPTSAHSKSVLFFNGKTPWCMYSLKEEGSVIQCKNGWKCKVVEYNRA